MNVLTRKWRTLTGVLAATMLAGAFVVAIPGMALAAGQCPQTLSINGSSTLYPILHQADGSGADVGFDTKYPGCTTTVVESSSGTGLTKLMNGEIDLAPSSSTLTAAQKDKLFAWPIGRDAMAFVVNNTSAMSFISNITDAQVKGIWEGTITDWQDLGASESHPITPLCRVTDSGTRKDLLSFFSIVEGSEVATCNATGLGRKQHSSQMADAAAANDYYIAYTSLDNVPPSRSDLKALTLGNVAPTTQNVQNGTYPKIRTLWLAVRKPSQAPRVSGVTDNSSLVRADDFVNFMNTAQGQTYVANQKFALWPVPAEPPIPDYDVNLDGRINVVDLGAVTGRWGEPVSTCKGWIRADVNNDGRINVVDLGAVTGKWNKTPGWWFPW